MRERILSPKEVIYDPEFDVPHHRISLEADGQEIGFAEMIYFSEPIRFYYLDSVKVKNEHQGLKLGSEIVESVNNFLIKKKLPGLLLDIIKDDQSTSGIYERHGWQATGFEKFMVYSPQRILPTETLKKMTGRVNKWYNSLIRINKEST